MVSLKRYGERGNRHRPQTRKKEQSWRKRHRMVEMGGGGQRIRERWKIELNWECPKGKVVKSRKRLKKKIQCTKQCFHEILGALESGVTHCGGLPVSLPEYRPLSTPGQLLPAIERIWIALSPSLCHHILLYKGSKSAKNYIMNWMRGRKEMMKPHKTPETTLSSCKTEKGDRGEVPGCEQVSLN